MQKFFAGYTFDDVDSHLKKISKIAESFEGLCAGENNGRLGYNLTFVIAYIRVTTIYFFVFICITFCIIRFFKHLS